jgi:hypothetical protein
MFDRCKGWTCGNESLRAPTKLRPARTPAASTAKHPWSSPIQATLAGLPIEVQLQLVRYDGLAGEALQLQGIEHVLERHDGLVGA